MAESQRHVRTYDPSSCAVFQMTRARFGGLSNMAPGYSLQVNGVRIRTSEALYQACRFPHLPDVQREIIEERGPMAAKAVSRLFLKQSREDWDCVRVPAMRWCLRVKLAMNLEAFGGLLLSTGGLPIVERSARDDFWGAAERADGLLVGTNALGRLLMELREQLASLGPEAFSEVVPPAVPGFALLGEPITVVAAGSSQRSLF